MSQHAKPRWSVTAGTALIAALVLVLPSGCGAGTTTRDQADSGTAATPPGSPAAKPAKSAVPRLLGLTAAEAKAALRDANLTIGEIKRRPSGRDPGTVLAQASSPGSSLRAGAPVTIIVAAPLPRLPRVVGEGKAAAISQLEAAGFSVQIATKSTTSGGDNIVISESPSGGSRVKPASAVTLVISDLHKPPALSSAGSSNCTPGYSPCLPPASDYDCEGGSGDGPKYTGLVHVSGSDPYDLDRDGDGVACET